MRKLAVGLVTVALLAAGCGAGAGKAGDSTVAGGDRPITIAVGGPFSGPDRATGQQILAGAQLAADEINGAGGIRSGPRKGDNIRFVQYDDADDPARAASNIRKIADDKQVEAFAGSAISDTSIAAAPIAAQAGLPYLSVYASSDQIITAAHGSSSVFVVAPTFPAYSYSIVDVLAGQGYRRPAILHLQGSYGDGIAKYCAERLASLHIPAVAEESFVAGDTDMSPQLAKIKTHHPDALLIVGLADSDALILKQAHQLGLHVTFFDPGGITNSDTFLNDAGDLANGVTGNTPDSPVLTTRARALHDAYTKATGQSVLPDPAAFAYESIEAIAAAYAAGAHGRSDLAGYLHKISIDTALGSLRFAADGARLGGRLYIFTVRNGKPDYITGYEQTGPFAVEQIGLPK